MPNPKTRNRLRGLRLSAGEIQRMTGWPNDMVIDYLSNRENSIVISNLLDIEIDQKIEEIPTDFLDGSIPYAEDGLLVEDNTNFQWDAVVDKLIVNALDVTNDIDIGGEITSVEAIQFDLAAGVSVVEGQQAWNADDGTIDVGLPGGVVGQMFQEMYFDAKNRTGSDVPDGTPVMFAAPVGASGKIEFQLAISDGTIPSEYIMGITSEAIANGGFGKVTAFGKVRGIDTTGTPYGEVWADGDLIYVSATTAGDLTNVKPNVPNRIILVAAVVVAHNNGTLQVRPTWKSKLVDLDDVNGTATTVTGQIPVWDNVNEYFDFNYNITDYQLKDDFTEGSVLFRGATVITEDNDNLFYDDSNNRLGVGTKTPTVSLDVAGAVGIQELSADPTDPAEGHAVIWQSDGTATGDDGDLLYKEQSGAVIETGSLKYKDMVPSSITLNTGTLAAGTVSDVQVMFDGNVYHVDEVTGVPGFDIEFNFTGVDRVPSFVVCRWIYDGSATHYVTWDIWNYTTTAWDQLRMFKTSELYYASMTMYIPRASNGDYVDGSGNSMVRTYHHTSGNASHDIQIDYVGLTHSLQGVI
jgi:hypothetical protein